MPGAGERVHVQALPVFARQNHDRRESADVHEKIDCEIECETRPVAGHDGQEDRAGMGNARISEEPLDVLLSQSRKASRDHRQDCDGSEGRSDGHGAGRRWSRQLQENGEAGRFGHDRQEGRDGRGRAFVDVGRPHMERDESNLEREPDDHESHAYRPGPGRGGRAADGG